MTTEAGRRLLDEEWDNFDAKPWGSLADHVAAIEAEASRIDPDRLARALHAVYHDGKPGEPDKADTTIYCDEDADAIAKAYEEDAG